MSDEFVVYGNNDPVLLGHSYSHHEKPLVERLEDFMEEGYLDDVMTESESNIFKESVLSWINYHIPFDKKVDNIEGDFRDGVRFCHLLKSLKLQPELPHINPTPEEKKENLYYILSYMSQTEGKGGLDNEMKDDLSGQIFNAETASILWTIVYITVHHVIQRIFDPIHGRRGIDQLEYWLRKEVGMSGEIDHADIVSTDIEEVHNLVKLANYLKVKLSLEIDDSTPETISSRVLDIIHKETGIPPLLRPSIKLRDMDGKDYLWYYQLRYLWVAELYNASISNKSAEQGISGKGNVLPTSRPKDVILRAVEGMYQLQEKLEYQEQKCKVLYDWIQENIGSFKTEITAIETVSCISTRNIPLLTHLYKIMKDEQTQYNRIKLGCYKTHCEIQRTLKNDGREHVEYHPTYNIYKVEDQWNRLVKLERKLGFKIQEFILQAENRKDLFSQWKREISYVRQWLKRWQEYFTMVQESLKSSTSAELRKCLKTFKQRFMGDVEEQNHTEHCRLLSTLLIEFSDDTTEKERIAKETQDVSEEYEVFIKDAQLLADKIHNQQEESTSLDVMYNEQADLLENLDIQIHELYQYYSLRPHLHTEHSCDQLSGYVKETWSTLFDVSHEIDAVLSLENDIAKLKKELGSTSRNYLTNLTTKLLLQRWEGLLIEAKSLEDYILQQKVIAASNDETVHTFDYQVYKAVALLSSEMLGIARSIADENVEHAEIQRTESAELKAKSRLEAPKQKIEATNFRKTKALRRDLFATFEKIMDEIEKSAEQLPNPKIVEDAFEKILSLQECSANCFATIDMIMTDSETCNNYIFEREVNREDLNLYQNELDSCKLKAQLLPSFHNVTKMFYRKHKKARANRLTQDLKTTVQAVDPLYQRVTLSAWLNFRRLDVYSDLDNIESELLNSFQILSGNDGFITEKDLKDYLEPSPFAFFLKRATEYLGPDYEGEDKVFDYKRLIRNLVGKHKKLLIDPDPSALRL